MRSATTAAALLLLLAGCGEKDDRGLNYMPDMYQNQAVKAQEARRVKEGREVEVDDGQGGTTTVTVEVEREIPGMFAPTDGTVARDHLIADPDVPLEVAQKYVNPLPVTRENLKRGHHLYLTYCAVCHGKGGNANNQYLGGKFAGVMNLTLNEYTEKLSDGHYYHVIRNGIRRMPDYRAQMSPDDRWRVILYVRALQRAARLPAEEAERLHEAEDLGEYEEFELDPEAVPDYEAREWPGEKP